MLTSITDFRVSCSQFNALFMNRFSRYFPRHTYINIAFLCLVLVADCRVFFRFFRMYFVHSGACRYWVKCTHAFTISHTRVQTRRIGTRRSSVVEQTIRKIFYLLAILPFSCVHIPLFSQTPRIFLFFFFSAFRYFFSLCRYSSYILLRWMNFTHLTSIRLALFYFLYMTRLVMRYGTNDTRNERRSTDQAHTLPHVYNVTAANQFRKGNHNFNVNVCGTTTAKLTHHVIA